MENSYNLINQIDLEPNNTNTYASYSPSSIYPQFIPNNGNIIYFTKVTTIEFDKEKNSFKLFKQIPQNDKKLINEITISQLFEKKKPIKQSLFSNKLFDPASYNLDTIKIPTALVITGLASFGLYLEYARNNASTYNSECIINEIICKPLLFFSISSVLINDCYSFLKGKKVNSYSYLFLGIGMGALFFKLNHHH